jgi:predicted nuclease of restriction endonuclease-like (RecB) superfamily
VTRSAVGPRGYGAIQAGIVALLETARRAIARSINAAMTVTYWEIGRRIVEFEQKGAERANYGDALIERLAKDLTRRFGRGFSRQNLWQMRAFYRAWPTEVVCQAMPGKSSPLEILQTASGECASRAGGWPSMSATDDLSTLARAFPLPWSAYVLLLSVKNPVARRFYETEALRCGWSVRQLDRQINTQFYERTALSRNKAAMLGKAEHAMTADAVTPEEAIKDPFVLEFLDLKDEYSESDLEDALVQHLADFLLELGDDFAFIGRQRRLRLDDTWFRVDLLFFHRRLRCLLVIDLKAGKFSHSDAGQMHLYLNYAREHWTKPGENPPVGLIICAAKGVAEARYALEGLPNKVLAAEYQTVLPDENVLVAELVRTRLQIETRRSRDSGPQVLHEGSTEPV